ncbi:MAG TPA: DUF1847 domain-containing protein [Desulfopila sp.]|nr:DUF1847 domain-containing protein [Desulfopila sp.]
MNETAYNCAACPFKPTHRICKTDSGRYPDNCPTAKAGKIQTMALDEYGREPVSTFARQASLQEKDGYANRERGYENVRPAKPRIEEVLDFIEKMGYRKIGMAFCIGLRKEAAQVEKLFASRSLEMVSVICKVGRIGKEALGIGDQDKIAVGEFESMCNPILQAELLNEAGTEFNVLIGLCVGHDSLFLQYAKAPCTVLAVKDRVTGHNPLAAIYTLDSYYRALK